MTPQNQENMGEFVSNLREQGMLSEAECLSLAQKLAMKIENLEKIDPKSRNNEKLNTLKGFYSDLVNIGRKIADENGVPLLYANEIDQILAGLDRVLLSDDVMGKLNKPEQNSHPSIEKIQNLKDKVSQLRKKRNLSNKDYENLAQEFIVIIPELEGAKSKSGTDITKLKTIKKLSNRFDVLASSDIPFSDTNEVSNILMELDVVLSSMGAIDKSPRALRNMHSQEVLETPPMLDRVLKTEEGLGRISDSLEISDNILPEQLISPMIEKLGELNEKGLGKSREWDLFLEIINGEKQQIEEILEEKGREAENFIKGINNFMIRHNLKGGVVELRSRLRKINQFLEKNSRTEASNSDKIFTSFILNESFSLDEVLVAEGFSEFEKEAKIARGNVFNLEDDKDYLSQQLAVAKYLFKTGNYERARSICYDALHDELTSVCNNNPDTTIDLKNFGRGSTWGDGTTSVNRYLFGKAGFQVDKFKRTDDYKQLVDQTFANNQENEDEKLTREEIAVLVSNKLTYDQHERMRLEYGLGNLGNGNYSAKNVIPAGKMPIFNFLNDKIGKSKPEDKNFCIDLGKTIGEMAISCGVAKVAGWVGTEAATALLGAKLVSKIPLLYRLTKIPKAVGAVSRLAGGLAEATAFEATYAGLQGKNLFNKEGWIKDVLFTYATFQVLGKVTKGMGKLMGKEFDPVAKTWIQNPKYLGRLTTKLPKYLKPVIENLIISGSVETLTLQVITMAREGYYDLDFSSWARLTETLKYFGIEYTEKGLKDFLKSYAVILGLKIPHAIGGAKDSAKIETGKITVGSSPKGQVKTLESNLEKAGLPREWIDISFGGMDPAKKMETVRNVNEIIEAETAGGKKPTAQEMLNKLKEAKNPAEQTAFEILFLRYGGGKEKFNGAEIDRLFENNNTSFVASQVMRRNLSVPEYVGKLTEYLKPKASAIEAQINPFLEKIKRGEAMTEAELKKLNDFITIKSASFWRIIRTIATYAPELLETKLASLKSSPILLLLVSVTSIGCEKGTAGNGILSTLAYPIDQMKLIIPTLIVLTAYGKRQSYNKAFPARLTVDKSTQINGTLPETTARRKRWSNDPSAKTLDNSYLDSIEKLANDKLGTDAGLLPGWTAFLGVPDLMRENSSKTGPVVDPNLFAKKLRPTKVAETAEAGWQGKIDLYSSLLVSLAKNNSLYESLMNTPNPTTKKDRVDLDAKRKKALDACIDNLQKFEKIVNDIETSSMTDVPSEARTRTSAIIHFLLRMPFAEWYKQPKAPKTPKAPSTPLFNLQLKDLKDIAKVMPVIIPILTFAVKAGLVTTGIVLGGTALGVWGVEGHTASASLERLEDDTDTANALQELSNGVPDINEWFTDLNSFKQLMRDPDFNDNKIVHGFDLMNSFGGPTSSLTSPFNGEQTYFERVRDLCVAKNICDENKVLPHEKPSDNTSKKDRNVEKDNGVKEKKDEKKTAISKIKNYVLPDGTPQELKRALAKFNGKGFNEKGLKTLTAALLKYSQANGADKRDLEENLSIVLDDPGYIELLK